MLGTTVTTSHCRFYSARYERDSSVLSSPFHNYVIGNSGFTPFDNGGLLKQVFITDGIAKPQPTAQDACNIWLNPPIENTLLNNKTPQPGQLAGAVNNEFWKAFTHSDLFPGTDEQVMAALLKDYIDVDNVPSLLNAPCLEMVPMISQVTIPKNIMKYSVTSRAEGGAQGQPQVTVYTLHLLDETTLEFPIQVEVVWPFKNTQYRGLAPQQYSLEVEAFLVVDKNGAERNTRGFQNKGEWLRLTMSGGGSIPPVWNPKIVNENDCFRVVDTSLKAKLGNIIRCDDARDLTAKENFRCRLHVVRVARASGRQRTGYPVNPARRGKRHQLSFISRPRHRVGPRVVPPTHGLDQPRSG